MIDRRPGAWGIAGTLVLHAIGWKLAWLAEPAAPPVAKPVTSELVMVRWLTPDITPGLSPLPVHPEPLLDTPALPEAPPRPQPVDNPSTWTQPEAPEPPEPGLMEPAATQVHAHVDSPALPVTAPDFGSVLLLPNSGQPIHLRVYIDETGQVTQVQIIESAPQDEAFASQIAEVLQRTPHVPARRDGHNVASSKDIWLQLNTVPERRQLR